MQKLRQVLVEHSLKYSAAKEERVSIFNKIPAFEEEVKVQLEREVKAARENYDKGVYALPNRVVDCRSYPLYEFVRTELETCLLTGQKSQSPGSDIEKVYDAISDGKHVAPLMRVLDGWTIIVDNSLEGHGSRV
jgi:phenylalanine ammonia-lyase